MIFEDNDGMLTKQPLLDRKLLEMIIFNSSQESFRLKIRSHH